MSVCSLDECSERLAELTELVEDLAGNLEDATDTLEKVAQAVWPNAHHNDVREYRRVVQKARDLSV